MGTIAIGTENATKSHGDRRKQYANIYFRLPSVSEGAERVEGRPCWSVDLPLPSARKILRLAPLAQDDDGGQALSSPIPAGTKPLWAQEAPRTLPAIPTLVAEKVGRFGMRVAVGFRTHRPSTPLCRTGGIHIPCPPRKPLRGSRPRRSPRGSSLTLHPTPASNTEIPEVKMSGRKNTESHLNPATTPDRGGFLWFPPLHQKHFPAVTLG